VADIALHTADRGILIGASGTGKSTLAAHMLAAFRRGYPKARILVLDTKPRWRAETMADGTNTRRFYQAFAKGDMIPGSLTMGTTTDWGLCWDKDINPTQTVIAQRLKGSQRANVAFQIQCAERFFMSQRANRESLLYIDEGMDFFSTSGSAFGSDIVQRCFRAGREKNLTTLIGVQRPKGINLQCLTETNWCALFRINYTDDVKRLWEMGWPKDMGPPTFDQKFAFRLWREGSPQAPLYRLNRE